MDALVQNQGFSIGGVTWFLELKLEIGNRGGGEGDWDA